MGYKNSLEIIIFKAIKKKFHGFPCKFFPDILFVLLSAFSYFIPTSFFACSRSLNFWILPEAVSGNSFTMKKCFGVL